MSANQPPGTLLAWYWLRGGHSRSTKAPSHTGRPSGGGGGQFRVRLMMIWSKNDSPGSSFLPDGFADLVPRGTACYRQSYAHGLLSSGTAYGAGMAGRAPQVDALPLALREKRPAPRAGLASYSSPTLRRQSSPATDGDEPAACRCLWLASAPRDRGRCGICRLRPRSRDPVQRAAPSRRVCLLITAPRGGVVPSSSSSAAVSRPCPLATFSAFRGPFDIVRLGPSHERPSLHGFGARYDRRPAAASKLFPY
jgi:hypothetical protein